MPKTTFIAKPPSATRLTEMEQSPKPAEAPKPKSRNMLLAMIIVAILVVVGVGIYIYTMKPTGVTGTPVSIWDTSGSCLPPPSTNCGFKNSTGGAILRITTGTIVTWTNTGGTSHTATACVSSNPQFSSTAQYGSCPSGGNAAGLDNFDSGTLSGGATFSHTFNTAGNYSYYCSLHPWMHGTIIVS